MKRIGLLTLSLTVLLSACATPQHIIDRDRISSAKNQVFHVRSVKLDCFGMNYIPKPPFNIIGCTRDCQSPMLSNIPVADIIAKLSESYGITIAKEQLSLQSEIMNIVTAAVSDSAGRCFYLQGSAPKDEPNAVDIIYTVQNQNIPPSVTVGYEVKVLTSENILIKHEGFIKSFEYEFSKGNYFKEAMKDITTTADKIPAALERDIKAFPVTSKP